MSIKLIALGNILMGDDGIAMAVADNLNEKLSSNQVEVIRGETDISYCMSMIQEEDYLILLDAARLGKNIGELTEIPLSNYRMEHSPAHHKFRLPDYIKLCFPEQEGMILTIEVHEVKLCTEISIELANRVPDISQDVLTYIMNRVG